MSTIRDIVDNNRRTTPTKVGDAVNSDEAVNKGQLDTARQLYAPETAIHNITADADYTLTTTQNLFGRVVITDTGVFLTVAKNIIVDTSIREFIVKNETAQTLTFKTSAGTGIAVLAGQNATLYCDGTNVISAGQNVYVIDANYVDLLAIGANPTAKLYNDGTVIGSTDNGSYRHRNGYGSFTRTLNGAPSTSTYVTFPLQFKVARYPTFIADVDRDTAYPTFVVRNQWSSACTFRVNDTTGITSYGYSTEGELA